MQTLKQKFEYKKSIALQEKLQRIDQSIVGKGITFEVIQEAIDKSELQKINKILKMLQALPKGLNELDTKVKSMMAELNAKVGTEEIQGLLSAVMESASVITAGFNNLQVILSNNFEKDEFEGDQTLSTMLQDDPDKKKNVYRQLVMAFTKEKVKKTFWQKALGFTIGFVTQSVANVKGKGAETGRDDSTNPGYIEHEQYAEVAFIDTKKLVNDILEAKLSLLSNIIKTIEKSSGVDLGNQPIGAITPKKEQPQGGGGGDGGASPASGGRSAGGGAEKQDSEQKTADKKSKASSRKSDGKVGIGEFDEDVIKAATKIKPALRGTGLADKMLAQVMKAAKDMDILKTSTSGGSDSTAKKAAAAAKKAEQPKTAETKATAEPAEPAEPADKQAEPAATAEPAKPAATAKQAKQAEPAATAEPAKPAATAKQAKQAEPAAKSTKKRGKKG